MTLRRRILTGLAVVFGLVVVLLVVGLAALQTRWFKDWLRDTAVRQAAGFVNGELSIGRLDGDLWSGVTLHDVAVVMEGSTVVAIDRIDVGYDVVNLLGDTITIDHLRIERPAIELVRTSSGWNLTRLAKERPAEPGGSRRSFVIRAIDVRGGAIDIDDRVGSEALVLPRRVESIDLALGVTSGPRETAVRIDHLRLRASSPALAVHNASGTIRMADRRTSFEDVAVRTERSALAVSGNVARDEDALVLDVETMPSTVALEEISTIVPALRRYPLTPRFTVKAHGPTDHLTVEADVREPQMGGVRANLTIDAVEPARRVAGTVHLEHLDVSPLVSGAEGGVPAAKAANRERSRTDITGNARIDFSLPDGRRPLSGTYALEASHLSYGPYTVSGLVADGRIDGQTIRVRARGSAYGARVTTTGTVTTADPLRLELQGSAGDVDLRRLRRLVPVPEVATDLDFEYRVSGRGGDVSGDAVVADSTLAGAAIETGTVVEFRVEDDVPSYAARGSVSELDLQQIGQGFAIDALSSDRYASRVNASFAVSGRGGGSVPLTLDADATIVDSTVFRASLPRMTLSARLAEGNATISAAGDFADLDPAVVSGSSRVSGRLSGSLDVETTLRHYADGVTVDSFDIAGRAGLTSSTINDVPIESVALEGRYAARAGEVTRLEMSGADLNVTASGPISLAETGSSQLVIHADSSSLETVGRLVGQPLKGTAIVDATVTGNAKSLEAGGTLKGTNIGHGENEALSLESTFTVTLPDLAPDRLAVEADSLVTLLEVGGQRIARLSAGTDYAESRLDFTAEAQEGVRRVEAEGTVVFHPDHQEIHLPRAVFGVEDVEWRTPEGGTGAAVRYFKDRVEIEGFQLMNAKQRITASGALGSPSDSLRVQIDNVDVAEIDRLLLRDERLAGRLNGEAVVSGPFDALRADSTFTLSQGAFGNFMYQSLTGNVKYDSKAIGLDVRLQATPTEWLAASGRAPLTLFRPTPPELGGTHQDPEPGEEVDIRLSSSDIGLGIIQAFTPAVRQVTGVMNADVRVTGSGYDPHFEGTFTIRGGGFDVPALGTSYSGLDTQIVLSADGVTVEELKILDARGFPMTLGGKVAMHARAIGAVDFSISSEKFEVIDNKVADLKLNTDLQVTGDLRRPRIVGSVEVENGTVHLAELLERVTSNPYSTEAAQVPGLDELPDDPEKTAASEETAPTENLGAFDALDLDVAFSVPDNLVLRGDDVRTANAPVALGDINITVGGMLDIRKPPAEPLRLTGDINTVRGTYTFQGRRFDVVRDGRIGFSGSEEIDPLLDVQARRLISGIETFVRVRGTMRKPELSFASNPPLDEADILALIIFNQPVNELGEGQQASLASQAAALAGGYVTSGLARSIGNALELDTFEIEAQADDGAGPRLTVGEQVGRNLYFLVRQAFGTEQTTELILEYQIAEFLRLRATGAQGAVATERVQFRRVERAGLDLLFFFSY